MWLASFFVSSQARGVPSDSRPMVGKVCVQGDMGKVERNLKDAGVTLADKFAVDPAFGRENATRGYGQRTCT